MSSIDQQIAEEAATTQMEDAHKQAELQQNFNLQRELQSLITQRRKAVENYRPIKRQYVHEYRQSCMQGAENIDDLYLHTDWLAQILGIQIEKAPSESASRKRQIDFNKFVREKVVGEVASNLSLSEQAEKSTILKKRSPSVNPTADPADPVTDDLSSMTSCIQ
jgi:hypothetical protein